MAQAKAYVELRSQKSVGSGFRRFGGPDRYVAVQIVPEGVAPLRVLNHRAAARRGIRIVWCGEGYAEHDGPRSSLGQALDRAARLAAAINAGAMAPEEVA